MPFYYDVNGSHSSSGSAGTELTNLWVKTAANQDTAAIKGVYVASRFGTAGGAQFRVKANTGTIAAGGTGQTPGLRNLRAPAASSVWANDGASITAGGTLVIRQTIGFAQTGGMGGWVAMEPAAAFNMMPNATNPADFEFTNLASAATVTFDATVEFSEST